jgi:hypothetical protein
MSRTYMFRSHQTTFRVPFATEYISVKMYKSSIQVFLTYNNTLRLLVHYCKYLYI